jgi:hypothetical protein
LGLGVSLRQLPAPGAGLWLPAPFRHAPAPGPHGAFCTTPPELTVLGTTGQLAQQIPFLSFIIGTASVGGLNGRHQSQDGVVTMSGQEPSHERQQRGERTAEKSDNSRSPQRGAGSSIYQVSGVTVSPSRSPFSLGSPDTLLLLETRGWPWL